MTPAAISQATGFIGSWLDFHARNDTTPGFAAAIQYKKKLIFYRAYGVANISSQAPLTENHLYNAGSQTKMYTAVAIMQLVERGLLSLDDPAVRHLPWLRAHQDINFRHLTIRQLLWHGAGLVRDGEHADYWQLFEPFPGRAQLHDMVLRSSLVMRRGHSLKYSDLGYALLGDIIAAVSRTTYTSYIQKNIIDRLGLADTFTGLSSKMKRRLPTCYSVPIEKQRLVLEPRPTAAFTSAAGLYMNASDACRFLAGLAKGDTRLLNQASKQCLLQDRRRHWAPDKTDATDYGLGFMFFNVHGNTLTGHSGSFAGFSSAAFADFDNELIVAIAATAKDAPILDMCLGVFEALYYFSANAIKALPGRRAHYAVRLRNLWQTVEIIPTHDRLVAIDPDEWFPFSASLRDLDIINDTKLKIMRDYDLLTPSEHILLKEEEGRIMSATYAGVTMVPEQSFVRWFERQRVSL